MRNITYRQRLALILGQCQRQRAPRFWLDFEPRSVALRRAWLDDPGAFRSAVLWDGIIAAEMGEAKFWPRASK